MVEEYLKGSSIVHRLDPRLKLASALVFSIVIALARTFLAAVTGLTAGVLILILAQTDFKQVLKRLILVNEFVVFLWFIIPLTYPGDPALRVNGLAFSSAGIGFVTLITLKCNAIMCIFIGLVATSSIFEIVHAMRHFFIPDKVVVLFFLIYRYTWVISAEYDNITRAMKSRGFNPRTSVHTYRTVGYLIGSLLVKSYARAENIYKAMRCRGFNGQFWILDHFRISFRDVVAGAAFALYNTVILLVQ